MLNRLKGRGQAKCDASGPPAWELEWGRITHSCENKTITETEDIQISINIGEEARAHSSRMTHRSKPKGNPKAHSFNRESKARNQDRKLEH